MKDKLLYHHEQGNTWQVGALILFGIAIVALGKIALRYL